ncbi:hypothetical protein J3R82DRAFT_2365 [Butyriboletus roseoflavus]|nr:hypothetical protein J3R82DRAFT_2365 [Butyriboletus roseoflavus]
MAVGYIRRELAPAHLAPSAFFLVQVQTSSLNVLLVLDFPMDVDWCLSCERKLVRPHPPPPPRPPSHLPQDDFPAASGPYCSPECLSYAQPSSSLRAHPAPLPPSGAYRIRDWAQAIPPHIPAGAPALPFADLPPSSPLPSERPPSPRIRHQPTPKLIERTAASTPLPTLSLSSPAHVRPPYPARPPHTYSNPTAPANTTTCMSEASTSLTSLLTEPLVATPDEDASFGVNIGALVRSWVGRDRSNSTKSAKDVYVIEKVTDYFPAVPQGKKPLSSSKKSKKTPVHSPAPLSRHKLPAKKVFFSPHRDPSTPTHSHTPTPVIFPSCRAAELDWVDGEDEDQDEIVVAPQPQYHPAYYQKCDSQRQIEPVHWTRAPSLSSSLASSDSSVLLMAPKRWDGVRGRKGTRAIAA